jgi:hypothetical protein
MRFPNIGTHHGVDPEIVLHFDGRTHLSIDARMTQNVRTDGSLIFIGGIQETWSGKSGFDMIILPVMTAFVEIKSPERHPSSYSLGKNGRPTNFRSSDGIE